MSESTRKRLSMNTVLMNARIFDEVLLYTELLIYHDFSNEYLF